jgi:hypothetical protein
MQLEATSQIARTERLPVSEAIIKGTLSGSFEVRSAI